MVRLLDNAGFPPSSLDQQRAPAGELEDAVAAGDVHLLERDGEPVAYLHLNRRTAGRIYVSGLAVRPDLQGYGLGKLMADHFILSLQDQWLTSAVVTVTSPRNHVMLRLLFGRGFAGRWLLRDFFGPGRHRLGCQLQVPRSAPTGLVQVAADDELPILYSLMEDHQHIVRGIVRTPAGPYFLMSPEQAGEFLDCAPPD